jgi:hypothetical protein
MDAFPSAPKWDLFHFHRDNSERLLLEKKVIIHSFDQLVEGFRQGESPSKLNHREQLLVIQVYKV